MAEKEIKQVIMRAAISLVEQGDGRLEEVTVRDIAAAAGVGVGLINYHFGSKDELLRLCAQTIVSEELERFHLLAEKLSDLPPLERLRRLAKRNCDYLAARPNLSRMSIFTDLRRGDYAGDNTDQNMAGLPAAGSGGRRPAGDCDGKPYAHPYAGPRTAGRFSAQRQCEGAHRIGLL